MVKRGNFFQGYLIVMNHCGCCSPLGYHQVNVQCSTKVIFIIKKRVAWRQMRGDQGMDQDGMRSTLSSDFFMWSYHVCINIFAESSMMLPGNYSWCISVYQNAIYRIGILPATCSLPMLMWPFHQFHHTLWFKARPSSMSLASFNSAWISIYLSTWSNLIQPNLL